MFRLRQFRQFRLGVSVLLGLVALAALAADGSRMIERRGEEDDGQIAKAPYWAPAVAPNARVDDLHKEYYNIFQYGNRNAASHLWATFLLDRGYLMTEKRLSMFFSGFCAVSGSSVRPSEYNRYRLTLAKLGGGHSTGYMHYCCWPCVCDTQDFIKVDTKSVMLANGVVRKFQFAVIGNPCDDPDQLTAKWRDPFGRRGMTSIAESAAEVRCNNGRLEGATLSDHNYIIIGMFFDSEDAIHSGNFGTAEGARSELRDPTPGRMSRAIAKDKTGYRGYQDEREYIDQCEDRAMKGYNSGMGEIFRKVCSISPISATALTSRHHHEPEPAQIAAISPSCDSGRPSCNSEDDAASQIGNRHTVSQPSRF
mmetsp:Transcript_26331/g.60186  ORF Transcript_26331/g.60186 Transcript_26331/m.60186 type:complete len:366 (-) Transcript_26331:9-1106(-)